MIRSAWQRLRRGVPAGFFRNVAWQYSASLWAGVATFAYGVLVGKYLGAAEYGLIAMGMGFAQVFSQALELRLQEAVIKYVAQFWETGEHGRAVAAVKLSVLVNCVSTALATALIFLAYPLAPESLREDPRGLEIVILAALTVLMTNFAQATCQGLLRTFGQFRVQAWIMIASNTVKLVGTVAILLGLRAGVLSVMALALAVTVASSLAMVWVTYAELRRNVEPELLKTPIGVLRPLYREMFVFVRSTYFLSLSMIPTRDLDVNLLGWFTSKETVGIYRMAKNFMAAVWILSDAAFLVVYPELARLWSRGEQSRLWAFIKRLVAVMGAFGVALYAGGCVTVPIFVHYVLGPAYDGTGFLFALMAWGLLFWAPMVWANPLLMAAGRPDLVLRASVLGSLLMLCSSLYMIPRWGAAGSAFTFALANPVVMGLVLFYGWYYGVFRMSSRPAA